MFDTSIQTQATRPEAVSPVVNESFETLAKAAPFVGEAVEAGISFKAGKDLGKELNSIDSELSGLDKQFSNMSEAIASGASKSKLALRAKTALNAAIASSPSSKAQADQLYANYFGGSAGTSGTSTTTTGGYSAGSFALTPQEKAAEAAQKEAYEHRYGLEMAGYSPKDAQDIYAMKKQGEVDTLQIAKLANESKVNMYQVQGLNLRDVTSWSVDFNVAAQKAMNDNGGTISNESRITMGREIDANLVKRMRALQAAITDPTTGMLTVSPDNAKALYKELDDAAKSQKLLLKDNSLQEFMTGKALTMEAEAKVAASMMLPDIAVIKAAGGTEVANNYVNFRLTNNPKALKYLEARYPSFAKILSGQNPVEQYKMSIGVGAKVMGSNGTEFKISQEEAIVAGTNIASNRTAATAALGSGNTSVLKKIGKLDPASLAATFDPSTQVNRTKNASNYSENIQALQDGSMLSFVDLYRQTHKSFPTGIQVAVQTPTNVSGQYGKRGAERIVIRDKDGTALSQDLVNQAADLYRSIKANPDALPTKLRKYYDQLGPAGVTTLWLNSGMDIADFEPQFEDISSNAGVQSGYAPTGLIKEEQARAKNTPASSEGTNTLTKAAEMQGAEKPAAKEEVEKKKLTEKTNDFFSKLPEEFKEEFSALWGAFTKDFETTKTGKRGIYGD